MNAFSAASLSARDRNDPILPETRDLAIRALEARDSLGPASEVLDAMLRASGLYPYLPAEDALSLDALLALEAHRPLDAVPGADLVFHRGQAEVYARLLDGDNVVLSAPTSFGKSLIIDALLAGARYDNVVLVVPTIALIDETRRRLHRRFSSSYKVITHPSQAPASRNVFVYTQERVFEQEEFPDIDVFVIDEFYLLSPSEYDDQSRAVLLNQALDRLLRAGPAGSTPQFYFLGPLVRALVSGVAERLDFYFMHFEEQTVAVDFHYRRAEPDRQTALVTLARELLAVPAEPTLIYCRSPSAAHEAARWLLESDLPLPEPAVADAVRWMSTHYHPEWMVPKALRRGIGIHHGRVPRSLARYMLDTFDEGQIPFLICTSTLIQGVNTAAKNVVVFDDHIGDRVLDAFTFNNIRGRAGRMTRHYVGRVYSFFNEPTGTLPDIDVPAVTQSEGAPPDLLIQLADEDLTEEARARLEPFLDQEILPRRLMQENSGLSLQGQLDLASAIEDDVEDLAPRLAWKFPRSLDDLTTVFELVWKHFFGDERRRWGVAGPRQLAVLTWRFNEVGLTARGLIDESIAYQQQQEEPRTIDDVVTDILDFLRQGLAFQIPRYLRAVDRIQRHVLESNSKEPGDYRGYAAALENMFLRPPTHALDEFGIPMEVSRKLVLALGAVDTFDDVIARLKSLDPEQLNLTPFERTLFGRAVADL